MGSSFLLGRNHPASIRFMSLLTVENLVLDPIAAPRDPLRESVSNPVKIEGVSFSIAKKGSLGLVGEESSGKDGSVP